MSFRNPVCDSFPGQTPIMPKREGLTVREFLAAALGLVPVLVDDFTRLQVGSVKIEVSFSPGELDLPRQSVIAWVSKAAKAVAHYYGQCSPGELHSRFSIQTR